MIMNEYRSFLLVPVQYCPFLIAVDQPMSYVWQYVHIYECIRSFSKHQYFLCWFRRALQYAAGLTLETFWLLVIFTDKDETQKAMKRFSSCVVTVLWLRIITQQCGSHCVTAGLNLCLD